jgi:hypothetical protein
MSPQDLPWTSLRSDGALNARGYATASVQPSPPRPVPDAERVVFVDPRRTATTPASHRTGAGPRAPEQLRVPEPSPGIELPDGRPLMKAQRVWIDPELLAQWDAEDRQSAPRPEAGASGD